MSDNTEKQPLLLHQNNSNYESHQYNIQETIQKTDILYPNIQIPEDIQPIQQIQPQITQNHPVTIKIQNNLPNTQQSGSTPLDSILQDQIVPILTEPEAVMGLILNVIFPGLGTIYYGLLFTPYDKFQVLMGVIQILTSFTLKIW